jgi:hypothetical protein
MFGGKERDDDGHHLAPVFRSTRDDFEIRSRETGSFKKIISTHTTLL